MEELLSSRLNTADDDDDDAPFPILTYKREVGSLYLWVDDFSISLGHIAGHILGVQGPKAPQTPS